MCEECRDTDDIGTPIMPYIVAGKTKKNSKVRIVPISDTTNNPIELEKAIEVEANEEGEFTVDLAWFENFESYEFFRVEMVDKKRKIKIDKSRGGLMIKNGR